MSLTLELPVTELSTGQRLQEVKAFLNLWWYLTGLWKCYIDVEVTLGTHAAPDDRSNNVYYV
jgi:hypothetical protein